MNRFRIIKDFPKIAVLLLVSFSVFSQSETNKDPLGKMSSFVEFGALTHFSQAQLKYELVSPTVDRYQIGAPSFLPNVDLYFNVGAYSQDLDGEFVGVQLKSGLFYQNRQTALVDTNLVTFQLRERYLTLPISFGFRIPQAYRTVKNEQYRANEVFIGFNFGYPLYNVLVEKDAPFALKSSLEKQYPRVGFHLELAHTSYNAMGKGHRFGLRYQFDTPVIGALNNARMTLVNYHSLGLFYNLFNDRTLRLKVKK